MVSFVEKVSARVEAIDSLLCVGIDPHEVDLKSIHKKNYGDKEYDGKQAMIDFCRWIIDETKDVAAAYKPNSAFFEAHGAEGFSCLKSVIEYIPKDIPVILDCKRGDISSTADAYASAAFDYFNADAVTLSPYMGFDSVSPFVTGKFNEKYAFLLVKTSNPSADCFQKTTVDNTRFLFEDVAFQFSNYFEDSKSKVGMVLGATDSDSMTLARESAPELWILAPGVGFQGGSLEATVRAGIRASDGFGLLIPVSRGISRSDNPKAEAEKLRNEISVTRNSVMKSIQEEKISGLRLTKTETKFFNLCVDCGVLKFGDFTLKSGRKSPYFFNAGLFNTGYAMNCLATCYAETIISKSPEFDVLFGPAYKGIPLVAAVSMALNNIKPGEKFPMAYNRKEAKDHGEGGVLVGADMKGKRILVLDDVITSGLAISDSIKLLKTVGAKVVAVCIALDRQETRNFDLGDIEIISVGNLNSLISFLGSTSATVSNEEANRMREYRDQYGIKL